MKVLSIDIDYITEKYARDVVPGVQMRNPHMRWWFLLNKELKVRCKEINFNINFENLCFLLDIFNSAATKDTNVMFAVNHHSILLELDKVEEKMDIINIDHHHDILYGESDKEDTELFDVVHCGSWIWHLHKNKKINSYTWIKNKNSETFEEGLTNSIIPEKYNPCLRENLDIDLRNEKFDFIFVCMSPEYIHPDHWQYFYMLKHIYEEKIGKEVQFIQKISEIDPKFLNYDSYKNISL